jgi:nucleoid DNA-binding protein
MTSRIRAIHAYRPRILLNRTVQLDELAEHIRRGTALNKGEIINVLTELHEAVAFFASQGTPVRIPGLGIYTPSIRLNGKIHIGHRPDRNLHDQVNAKGTIHMRLKNATNTGLNSDQLIEMWNVEHPDDPVED